jgi:hypothetical protein
MAKEGISVGEVRLDINYIRVGIGGIKVDIKAQECGSESGREGYQV